MGSRCRAQPSSSWCTRTPQPDPTSWGMPGLRVGGTGTGGLLPSLLPRPLVWRRAGGLAHLLGTSGRPDRMPPPRLCLPLRRPGRRPQHSDPLSVFAPSHHGWAGQAAGWLAARHIRIPCLPPMPLTAAWWPDLAAAAFKPTCASRAADPRVRQLMGSRRAAAAAGHRWPLCTRRLP